MYFYLYDTFVQEQKHEVELISIEHKLIDFGINGKIGKLSVLKNIEQMTKTAVLEGAHTIVIVGNDKTFSRALKTLANEDVAIGYLPLDPKSRYAQILGINDLSTAVEIISKRVIKKIDIGRINNTIYFLTSVEILGNDVVIECDKKFKIIPEKDISKISICNFGNILEGKELLKNNLCDPNDGNLQINFYKKNSKGVMFKKITNKDTALPAKKLFLTNKGETDNQISLEVDGEIVAKTPATVELAHKKINLIVGRERMF